MASNATCFAVPTSDGYVVVRNASSKLQAVRAVRAAGYYSGGDIVEGPEQVIAQMDDLFSVIEA